MVYTSPIPLSSYCTFSRCESTAEYIPAYFRVVVYIMLSKLSSSLKQGDMKRIGIG